MWKCVKKLPMLVKLAIVMYLVAAGLNAMYDINGLSLVVVPLLLSKVGTDTFIQMAAGKYDEAAITAILPNLAGFILYTIIFVPKSRLLWTWDLQLDFH